MSVCILTDSAVQFPNPVFEGRSMVSMLPTKWEEADALPEGELKASDLAQSVNHSDSPLLQITSTEAFQENFQKLGTRCDGVIAILSSSYFDKSYENALKAAEFLQGSLPIKVINSKTTSLGLGILIQIAAQLAEQGTPLSDLELRVRSLLPRIYSFFCIPSLSYLQRRGYLNSTQATVAEFLGMLPVFTLDNGELTPSEKARNKRHLVDIMQEFLAEFSELEHIALLQGIPSFEQETRALRERLAEDHPSTQISEQIITAPLASQIGPHSLGIFALQSE